jgi:hypothetical protein
MEVTPRQVEVYETLDGKQPFIEWLSSLKDKRTVAIILLEAINQSLYSVALKGTVLG